MELTPYSTNYDAVRKSIKRSVDACGLGYIDLFLLHSPYGGREARLTSWRAIEDAIDAGEVRSGGVSNYGVKHVGLAPPAPSPFPLFVESSLSNIACVPPPLLE